MLVLLPLLLLLLAGGVLWQRADFEHYPLLRVLLLLCAYGVAIVLAFSKELSESPRRAPLRDYVGLLAFALFGAVNWIPRWYSPEGPASSQTIASANMSAWSANPARICCPSSTPCST
jgi:hypothetical protein